MEILMTAGADAINRPLLMAGSRQETLPHQGSTNDAPCDFALAQYPLKLAFLNMERPGVAARWTSVADSSDEMRKPGGVKYHNAGSVYERIKLSLLQRPWMPGELLQIGMFARELGTSTTPVREALARLAAERLIAYMPKKGFLVKAITEEELRGLYIVNQMHVQTALRYFQERTDDASDRNSNSFTRIAAGQGGRGADLAFTAARLFLSIASSAGIEEIVAMVCNINDRLHRPRIAEYTVIDDTQQELSVISGLFAAGELDELNRAIQLYHELRLRMLPSIFKELLSVAFARR